MRILHTAECYRSVGFKTSEIVALLAANGIFIASETGGKEDAPPVQQAMFPKWKRVLGAQRFLTVSDITHAFINADPYDECFLSDELQADYARYRYVICEAIAGGELGTTRQEIGDRAPDDYLNPDELYHWCAHKGWDYPLPRPQLSPVQTAQEVAEPVAASQGRWPWGDHSTKLLEALADAARQQWSTYDPEQPSTAPTNDEVSEYLQKRHGVKPTMANAMATILRVDGLQTGRRKKG